MALSQERQLLISSIEQSQRSIRNAEERLWLLIEASHRCAEEARATIARANEALTRPLQNTYDT